MSETKKKRRTAIPRTTGEGPSWIAIIATGVFQVWPVTAVLLFLKLRAMWKNKRLDAYRACLNAMGDVPAVSLRRMAGSLGKSEQEVSRLLTEMISNNYLGPEAYIDYSRGMLYLKHAGAQSESASASAACSAGVDFGDLSSMIGDIAGIAGDIAGRLKREFTAAAAEWIKKTIKAHERILFERMKENMYASRRCEQLLLIPEILQLSPEEFAAACEYRDEIEKTGFSFDADEETLGVKLTSRPSEIEQSATGDVFMQILSSLSSGGDGAERSQSDMYERALFQASCKAAVKAGREDDISHIEYICDAVMNDPRIRFCPHGRPVSFELTTRDIEKRFKRI